MNERRTIGEWLDLMGGHVEIGPPQLRTEPDGTWLMGNRIREYDRHGRKTRDEVIYVTRLLFT